MARLALLALPVLELIGILLAADRIGAGWTMLALAAGVVAGAGVIRFLGAASLRDMKAAMDRQEPPMGAALDGLVALGAGLLLIVPGFLTDALALGLLLSPVRRAAGRLVWGGRAPAPRPSGQPPGAGPDKRTGGVIEGNYERID